MPGANSSAIQIYREIPSHSMSPYETYDTLPKGAFVGQQVEFNTPDRSAYIVAKNSDLPIYGVGRIPAGTTNGITHGNIDPNDEDPRNSRDPQAFRGSAGLFQRIRPSSELHLSSTLTHKVNQGRNRLDINLSQSVAENELSGGKITVTTNVNLSRGNYIDPQTSYYISRNTASTGSSNATTIYLLEEIRHRLIPNSTLEIVQNPYNGVFVSSTREDAPAGFTVCSVPAEHYFLALVRGIVLLTATPNHGGGIIVSPSAMYIESQGQVASSVNAADKVVGHTLDAINVASSGQFYGYVNMI